MSFVDIFYAILYAPFRLDINHEIIGSSKVANFKFDRFLSMESVRAFECVEAKIDSSLDDLIKSRKMQLTKKTRQMKRSTKIKRVKKITQLRGSKISQSQRNPMQKSKSTRSLMRPNTSQMSPKSKAGARNVRVGRPLRKIALRKPRKKQSSKLSLMKSKKVGKKNGKKVIFQVRNVCPNTTRSKRGKAIQSAHTR
ncbi:unnamed protein product [Albugo candida]|uniref:Uncharacterized protein n=1 Tax=Albugo candida TaxID=65357 RepID=A0A024FZC3_9STRA|nr:unnamed protein product [Albugo candida]|eukprot:CCI39673.1 unnamed protein product [Albugo candida]